MEAAAPRIPFLTRVRQALVNFWACKYAKVILVSAIVALISGSALLLRGDSVMTCDIISTAVVRDQFLGSITLSPKASLNRNCIEGLLQHKHEVKHLKIEKYINVESVIYQLAEFPNLQTLELVNVNLKWFDMSYLDKNENLYSVILDNNPGLSFYGETKAKLTKLSLANCGFTSIPSAIYALGDLYELNLHGNKIVDQDVDFARLNNLGYYNGLAKK